MFGNIASIFDKLMLKSLGYGIMKYINNFLGIIGIDLHFFTFKVIIIILILCSLILIVRFGSLLYNLVRKNDFKTEKTAKTIKTIRTEKTGKTIINNLTSSTNRFTTSSSSSSYNDSIAKFFTIERTELFE